MVFHMMERGYYSVLLAPEAGNGNELSVELAKGDWTGTQSTIAAWDLISPGYQGYRPGAGTPEAGGPHKLSVTYDRGQITLRVDDRNVGSIHDTTFQYGLVGFGVFGHGRIVVRDLLVEAVQ
jgi:hypothetical protein